MSKDFEKLKEYLRGAAESDDLLLGAADKELKSVLRKSGAAEKADGVRAFMSSDECSRRKMLYYCIDYIDPTVCRKKPHYDTLNYSAPPRDEYVCLAAFTEPDKPTLLYEFIKRHENDESFGDAVYKMIDSHGMTAPKVYKNALLRRQDFFRAVDPKAKNITKQLVWQIIVGLHCDLDEADGLLFSAGYVRRKTKFDLIMEYFIDRKTYDIMDINDALDEFGLKPFSCDKPVCDNDSIK